MDKRTRVDKKCTKGGLLCSSIGYQKLGVVRNHERPTRMISSAIWCRASGTRCSMAAFEKTMSMLWSAKGRRHAPRTSA